MPPAARVTDMHTCPMVTGVVPHVGGPILPAGHPTTLIGGLPAARIGDMLTCTGPPDVIVKGSPTVIIGGMPAARMGDNTAHGGVIVLGHGITMIGDSGSGGGGGGGGAAGAGDAGAGGAPGTGAAAAKTPPTQAPTAAELENDPTVHAALEQAWTDSQPNNAANRHEEGGWIYMDTSTGDITVERAPAGAQAGIDLSRPPHVPGSVVVGKFHTHPNPTSEGWDPGPSDPGDVQVDARHGVPDLIRADDGVHHSGPDSRRGGLAGGPGFPR